MTVTLSLAEYFDKLNVEQEEFHLQDNLSHAQDRAGRVYTSEGSPRLWVGTVILAGDLNWLTRETKFLLHRMMQPGVRFMVRSRTFVGPQKDKGGVLMGSATPILYGVSADSTQVRISGLPAGYQLTMGDAFSWGQAAPHTQRYHEVAENVTADGAGLTPMFKVNPPVTNGHVLTSPVTFVRPYLKAAYIPQSMRPFKAAGPFSTGAEFRWVQTLE